MLNLLKEIILDFQESELETGTPRRLDVTALPGKATVCIGARRSGKTTLMFQLAETLLSNGVRRENILYLNFFDDRLRNLGSEGLALVTEAYFSLYPEKKSKQKIYCFFDEIQTVPGWEHFVDRIMRTEKCEVCITGSSAGMLSHEIATQMRGRSLSWELFPFSFREFLDSRSIASDGALSSSRRLHVRRAFDDFWNVGGFPEVSNLDRRMRIKIHQEYWNAMLFRDIVERHDVQHPRAVADLAHRLVQNIASLYTINRLTAYVKSLNHRLTKAAVSDCLEWFEDAFFLFTVRIYDASLARANVNPKKIYCVDHALVRSVSSGMLTNSGHLLENLVFTALRRVTSDIFYYRSRTGREVDFIVRMPDGTHKLVQVCESLLAEETRQREVRALRDCMAETGINTSLIVTLEDVGGVEQGIRIEVDCGEIGIVPIWRFLLDLD